MPDISPAEQFRAALLNDEAMLASAIEWISEHLDPADVFDNDKLRAWAHAAGFQVNE